MCIYIYTHDNYHMFAVLFVLIYYEHVRIALPMFMYIKYIHIYSHVNIECVLQNWLVYTLCKHILL